MAAGWTLIGVGRDEEFGEFVLANRASLLRSAHALAADRGVAEDLVQTTLLKTYVSWERIKRADSPYNYARRILFNSFSRTHRRLRLPEALGYPVDGRNHSVDDAAGDRDQLSRALNELSASHRAVLVLRFYEDLSVEQTAQVLGCSTGTVKSRTARALAQLRLSPQLKSHEER